MKSQVSEKSSTGEGSNVSGDVRVSKQTVPAPDKSSKPASGVKDENRDDWDNRSRRDAGDERENVSGDRSEQTVKRSQTKPSPSRKSKSSGMSHPSPHPSPQRHYMHEGYPSYHQPPPGRGPYHPPHGMHGGPRGPPPSSAPYPPPPPPHYYGGAPHDHYRGPPPPPPHYHQMPPLPHPGQPGHYGGPNGHYCPPPNMAGRPGPPPPGYHPPYGAPYPPGPPPMSYHGAPPSFPPQGNPSHTVSSGACDSNSISSSKSKGSLDRRSTKSQSSSSGSRKKRTIDGVHENNNTDKNLPVAYTFRRSNSNASTSSTVTAANNTSTETHPLSEESPHKRERTSSRSSNQLPPLSHSSNIFHEERIHRRNYSGASTASSLSVGGFSLSSYEGPRSDGMMNDMPMLKSSPKRRKGDDSEPLVVDTGSDSKAIFKRKGHRRMASPTDSSIDGPESSRFEKLSMNDSYQKQGENPNTSLFLSLSTSPISHPEVDATPISKNTNKKSSSKITIKTDLMEEDTKIPGKASPFRKPILDRPADTPTPPIPGGIAESEMMTDEDMLNRHLRGQTFTPLPHMSESSGTSPANTGFSAIAPQLSWSIAGDTPSLEDLATCSWEETEKDDKKRPGSTTSQLSSGTRGIVISPHSFSLWKEEHESNHQKKGGEEGKDNDSMRFSLLSPNSEIVMAVDGTSGTTTPLPLFFDQPGSEERENVNHADKSSGDKESRHSKQQPKEGDPDHIHHMFVTNGGRGPNIKQPYANPHYMWSKHDGHGPPPRDGLPPTPVYAGSKPPTPLFAGSNVGFARSPLHGDRRDHHPDFFKPDFFKSGGMFGHPPPGSHNDRVRNLRGRVPHGAHMAPMPIHIPPPMSSHHPLTSPMGIGHHGKAPMWSPHHGNMPPPLASPHHMSPMDMSQSKRKCVSLKPPIPSKFQGDMEKIKTATVPEFTSLVNFPAHMSQKQSVNLPEGMRCCVMCGQACPCSTGMKKKCNNGTLTNANKTNKPDGSLAPRSSNGQDTNNMMGDKNGYAIIPTQNKGLCTLCDVNVWVAVNTGLEIKWCKGCKNFRPWAAFGDKGLATKCLRCRERQREKYALQKEEKEKTRLLKGTKTKG